MSFIATTDMYIEMRNKRDLAEDKYHDMKKEHDKLKDDVLAWAVTCKNLEQENEELKQAFHYQLEKRLKYFNKYQQLKHENKALRLQSNTYFDEWQSVKNLYNTLTNHIRTKAENNPGVSRYIDLVNYIDRLERDK